MAKYMSPSPASLGGALASAIHGGVTSGRENKRQRLWAEAAAKRFEGIGSEEAIQMAGLIRQTPIGSHVYAERFAGGLPKLEQGMRERASRDRALDAVSKIPKPGSPEARGYGPRDVIHEFKEEIAGGDIQGTTAQMIAETMGAPQIVKQILARDTYTPESVANAITIGEQGGWGEEATKGAIGALQRPTNETRRIRVSGGRLGKITEGRGLEPTYEDLGPQPGTGDAVLAEPHEEAATQTHNGRWLERVILHQNLIKGGLEPGSAAYVERFEAAGMTPLSASEAVRAEVALRDSRHGEKSGLLEAVQAMQAAGGGGGGGGTSKPPGYR